MTDTRLLKLVPFLFVLLWSTGFIGAKYAMPYAEPFTLLCIRMLLSAALLLALGHFLGVVWPNVRTALHSAVSGVLIHAAYLGGIFAAIKQGMPAGTAALIVGMQPLLTAVLARLWMNEKLVLRQLIGLFIGLIGVAMVLLFRQPHSDSLSLSFNGVLFTLISVFGISIGTLYQKKHASRTSLLASTFYQYLASAAALGVLALLYETREIQWTLPLILALTWLVLVLSLAAVLLLMLMIREGQATAVASYFYLTPPVTVVLSWILFGEKLGLTAVAGLVVASLGVYLARTPSKKQ